MKTYLIGSVLFSLALLLVYYFGDGIVFGYALHRHFPVMVQFFFIQSIGVAWLFNEAKKADWQSPIYTLAAVSFRLLSGLFFVAFAFILKFENIRPLMAEFISLYLTYLAFELYVLLSNLRRN